jgi:hypothetical protein
VAEEKSGADRDRGGRGDPEDPTDCGPGDGAKRRREGDAAEQAEHSKAGERAEPGRHASADHS